MSSIKVNWDVHWSDYVWGALVPLKEIPLYCETCGAKLEFWTNGYKIDNRGHDEKTGKKLEPRYKYKIYEYKCPNSRWLFNNHSSYAVYKDILKTNNLYLYFPGGQSGTA